VAIPPEWRTVLARLSEEIRLRHLSPRTLKAYSQWARAFALSVVPLPPGAVTAAHAREFLSGLVRSGVAGATQNQAFSALRFLFVEVWRREYLGLEDTPRAPGRVRFPDALSRDEALAVLRGMRPPWKLAAQVLYGCGLRLREGLSLRVQDIDFTGGVIRTYNAKGSRSRAVPLPRKLAPLLEAHLRAVREGFEADLRAGFAGAFLQDGLERKMPRAALEWSWQWVFPAMRLTVSKGDGKMRRYHLHESGLQKEIRKAAARAGLARRVSPHTFRHSFATEMLRMGYDIRTVQDLLGHSDVSTTMIYTHVLAASAGRVVSPLDT
jgi:integron integrase